LLIEWCSAPVLRAWDSMLVEDEERSACFARGGGVAG
jgi:hypothetical protein